jgi:hypothetical protein
MLLCVSFFEDVDVPNRTIKGVNSHYIPLTRDPAPESSIAIQMAFLCGFHPEQNLDVSNCSARGTGERRVEIRWFEDVLSLGVLFFEPPYATRAPELRPSMKPFIPWITNQRYTNAGTKGAP